MTEVGRPDGGRINKSTLLDFVLKTEFISILLDVDMFEEDDVSHEEFVPVSNLPNQKRGNACSMFRTRAVRTNKYNNNARCKSTVSKR